MHTRRRYYYLSTYRIHGQKYLGIPTSTLTGPFCNCCCCGAHNRDIVSLCSDSIHDPIHLLTRTIFRMYRERAVWLWVGGLSRGGLRRVGIEWSIRELGKRTTTMVPDLIVPGIYYKRRERDLPDTGYNNNNEFHYVEFQISRIGFLFTGI